MPTIRFEGLDELQKALKKNVTMEDAKKVVRHHGAELQSTIQDKAVFVKGYSTGATKRSIDLTFEDSGFTAVVEPHTDYSSYVEYGTRKMEAQPFVRPGLSEQKPKFIRDMQKLVK